MPISAKDRNPSTETTPSRPDELLAIARAAGNGDRQAIATLLREVGGAMLRSVRKVLGWHHPDIEDVTQDASLAFLRSLTTFRAECTVQNFANRVALLTALAARRKLRGHVPLARSEAEANEDEYAASDGATPLQQAISSRRRELLLNVVERLPEKTSEALALHFILGHTVEEIAQADSVSVNTIWSRLRLGKEALRRGMNNDIRLRELCEGIRRS